MLAVVGTANVFAYTWSGTDTTDVQTQNYVHQGGTAYGDPFVSQGTHATWGNSLYDNDPNTGYYMAQAAWTDGAGVNDASTSLKLTYHSSAYTPTGSTSGQESTGDNILHSIHYYAINGLPYGPSTSYDHDYYVY
jgi:hypothetical protein